MRTRVLIAGAGGQLGRELVATTPPWADVVALARAQLDVANADAVRAALRELAPGVVINAAGYTAVDRAEAEPSAASAANADGPGHLADAAHATGARLVHVSTDFVFDGERGTPYQVDAATNPLGVYGATKLVGERRVLAACENAVVVRTAWVYAARGHNFVNTMLRLMRERPLVTVVADQVGTPTWARSVAAALWSAAARPEVRGVHHWTDAGVASWYDFAVAVHDEALALGLLERPVEVRPIATADYPTPARRPPYSVLEKSRTARALDLTPIHWRRALRRMLELSRDP